MLHTLSKGIKQGDIILTPRGDGHYLVGKVISDYYYVPSGELSHRRKVEWFEQTLPRELMSQELKTHRDQQVQFVISPSMQKSLKRLLMVKKQLSISSLMKWSKTQQLLL